MALPPIDRECFFISPIGDKGTEVRRRSDFVLERIVKKAAERLHLEPVRGDQIRQPGMVTEQVMYHATEARAAVADITDNNPNVIYELGIRAAVPKPVVLIVEEGSVAVPFNIQGLRKITYNRHDDASVTTCIDEIVDYLTNSYPSSYLESPTSRLVRSSTIMPSIPPGYEIGCRIGRRNIECGILNVVVSTTGLPTDNGVRVAFDVAGIVHENRPDFRPWSRDKAAFWKAFGRSVAGLVEAAAVHSIKVNAIGIAVPGGVLPRQGSFAEAVVGTPFDKGHETITATLAEYLQNNIGLDKLRTVFGVSDSRDLEARIHLDNDARCAARWVACAHAGDPAWRDYCCIFVSSGVGSGLVLDGEIYYGTHYRAGEVGHVTLNLQEQLSIDGIALEKRPCSCGVNEHHFESLVGVGGLGYLAESIGITELQAVHAWLQEQPNPVHDDGIQSGLPPHAVAERWAIDRYDQSGFVVLRAMGHRAQLSAEHPALGNYLRHITSTYARIFNVGTGTLMKVLDVDCLALCGVIPEVFFKDVQLRRLITTPVRLASGGPNVDWGTMRDWGWRGAALLSRDSGYMARR